MTKLFWSHLSINKINNPKSQWTWHFWPYLSNTLNQISSGNIIWQKNYDNRRLWKREKESMNLTEQYLTSKTLIRSYLAVTLQLQFSYWYLPWSTPLSVNAPSRRAPKHHVSVWTAHGLERGWQRQCLKEDYSYSF